MKSFVFNLHTQCLSPISIFILHHPGLELTALYTKSKSWSFWTTCQMRNSRWLHTMAKAITRVTCKGRFQTSVKKIIIICAKFWEFVQHEDKRMFKGALFPLTAIVYLRIEFKMLSEILFLRYISEINQTTSTQEFAVAVYSKPFCK